MTSLIRQYGPAKPYTKFINIVSPCYSDSLDSSTSRLIPFTCYNGVIDINVSDSGVQSYIDNASSWDSKLGKKVKIMGGESLGETFGPNFETWIRNIIGQNGPIGGGSSYDGPLAIKVKPIMTKVQACQGVWFDVPLPRSPVTWYSSVNPENDGYIVSGTPENNYYTSWVFKSPLTVEFQYSGAPYYVTLSTDFHS